MYSFKGCNFCPLLSGKQLTVQWLNVLLHNKPDGNATLSKTLKYKGWIQTGGVSWVARGLGKSHSSGQPTKEGIYSITKELQLLNYVDRRLVYRNLWQSTSDMK